MKDRLFVTRGGVGYRKPFTLCRLLPAFFLLTLLITLLHPAPLQTARSPSNRKRTRGYAPTPLRRWRRADVSPMGEP